MSYARHSYYTYSCLVCPEWAGEKRDALIRRMSEEFRVKCLILNPPVYETRRILLEHGKGARLPISDQIGKRLLCLPMHPAMPESENEYMAMAFRQCVEEME